jgi:hypothetical protein
MNLQSLVNQTLSTAVAPVKVKAKAKAPVKVEAKAPKATAVVKAKAPKAVKPPKVKLEPYTVFYKESRKKFMAVNGQGKTEAARKTVEAALAFLKNKYNVTGKVL